MKLSKYLLILISILVAWTRQSDALPAQHFEPLKDTLARYNIVATPVAADYPDIPAVGILSVHEYRQLGQTHIRTSHEIVKILTAAGKRYTTFKIPCYTECRVEGRTIKPDGKIVNIPGNDLVRGRQFTGYNAPFSFTQFAVPAVEPGDIVEIKSTILVPMTLFMEDFRFPEAYPVRKAVFLLSTPNDYSYAYFLQGKPGEVHVSSGKNVDSGIEFVQSVFDMDNVPASINEDYSPGVRQEQPGVRFLMTGQFGARFEAFKDWFSYGKLISQGARLDALVPRPVTDFVNAATGTATEPEQILRLIATAADRRIRIGNETLVDAGFEFDTPEKVLQKKTAMPHEFALFLAACFRVKKWNSELVLVNSHNLPETSRERPFPLDLDMVFVNVKTPSGEFLLDCNLNGIPFGVLSSRAMNRFALIIPIVTSGSSFVVSPALSTMPYRAGNENHIDLTWTPDASNWNVDFRWFFGGEMQAPFVRNFRQESEAEFAKDLAFYVRRHLRVDGIQDLNYQWLVGGLELRGKASVGRTKIGNGCELVQNLLWDAGFNFRQYLFEGRKSSFLLPLAGEISSTVTIKLAPGMIPALPAASSLESIPVRYTMSVETLDSQVRVKEKIAISDLLVRPPAFASFVNFLDQYYVSHFWTLLLTPPGAPQAGSAP